MGDVHRVYRCILLKFYIKPQPGPAPLRACRRLYLIEILHQTTTKSVSSIFSFRCILLKFYIKPQLTRRTVLRMTSCILLKFYIKPQQAGGKSLKERVVSYWNSTSNHNLQSNRHSSTALYLIEILHQTTTSCMTSSKCSPLYLIEILHQTTTTLLLKLKKGLLYLIEILHQTTTARPSQPWSLLLYLIEILHQTTTDIIQFWRDNCCILLKFYIKPQQKA